MKYKAFISYSHSEDSNFTATPTYGGKIIEALSQSSHLILLASPKAAQSIWGTERGGLLAPE